MFQGFVERVTDWIIGFVAEIQSLLGGLVNSTGHSVSARLSPVERAEEQARKEAVLNEKLKAEVEEKQRMAAALQEFRRLKRENYDMRETIKDLSRKGG